MCKQTELLTYELPAKKPAEDENIRASKSDKEEDKKQALRKKALARMDSSFIAEERELILQAFQADQATSDPISEAPPETKTNAIDKVEKENPVEMSNNKEESKETSKEDEDNEEDSDDEETDESESEEYHVTEKDKDTTTPTKRKHFTGGTFLDVRTVKYMLY
jgi:hypothetical protein